MKPVDQTKFGDPDGNCFAACLASLLECPIEDVPKFQSKPKIYWMDVYDNWLGQFGLGVFSTTTDPFLHAEWHMELIAGGNGPRGIPHTVLWKRGKMIHDPHPSRAGLIGEPTEYYIIVVRNVASAFSLMSWRMTEQREQDKRIAELEDSLNVIDKDRESYYAPVIAEKDRRIAELEHEAEVVVKEKEA